MKLVVALGNPGAKYETTRHNIGWLALDRMIEDWKATGPKSQNQALVWSATLDGEKLLLVKPQTFMNLSGQAVAPILQFFKCAPSDLIVIHDELDIPPGAMKLKTGGGNGGHNGLKSIDACIGSTEYHRVRLGIGHPRDFNPKMDVSDWVLGQFSQAECNELDSFFERASAAVRTILSSGMKKAANQFNQKTPDPKASAKETT